MSSSDLLKIAQSFQNQTANSTIIQQMLGLARGAVVATNHLLSLPKYKKSAGLQSIEAQIPSLQKELQNMNIHGTTPLSMERVKDLLSRMAFYTSKNNAGTGYDTMTEARDGGYSAPSYYINTMMRMFETLKQ